MPLAAKGNQIGALPTETWWTGMEEPRVDNEDKSPEDILQMPGLLISVPTIAQELEIFHRKRALPMIVGRRE